MENASKALRIAGAVLLGLMVTSLLLFAFNAWQKYQKKNLESIKNQQSTEFNGSFDVYNKKALRGSELVSLANKVNSTNKTIAGNSNYRVTYGLTNMSYRYEDSDMMPIRIFVAFTYDDTLSLTYTQNPVNPIKLPGLVTYTSHGELHQDWDDHSNNLLISVYRNNTYPSVFPTINSNGEYFIDLDEYIQKIYNSDKLVAQAKAEEGEEIRKTFKGYYFECIKVDFDNQTGKYSRMFFKQVLKINT